MQKTILIAGVALAGLSAQEPHVVQSDRVRVMAAPALPGPSLGTFTWMSAETSFEASTVKGMPFTGDFVTENTQTLADGNRIKNSNTTSYARDGEGRTRREVTIDSIGPFTGGAARKTVFIHDPVAMVDYVLDPQEKTVRKIITGPPTARLAAPAKEMQRKEIMIHSADGVKGETSTMVFERRTEGPKDVMVAGGGPGTVMIQRAPLPEGMVMQGEAGAVMKFRTALDGPQNNVKFKNEPLGKRMIEGVEAEGTRTTLTIPAGEIGNDLPLETVSERWYSNELKTVVLTTRKDPRTGESVYRLANLQRGEPARQLFEAPPDYKVLTEDNVGIGVMKMRLDHKEE